MRVNLQVSTMHTFFPRVVLCILAILAVVMLIQRFVKCKKDGTPFINLKGYSFFVPGYDALKFWGSIVLFAAYIYCLKPLHFLPASILFLFLFNVLFAESINFKAIVGKEKAPVINMKSMIVSIVISVVAPTVIYLLFHNVFHQILP